MKRNIFLIQAIIVSFVWKWLIGCLKEMTINKSNTQHQIPMKHTRQIKQPEGRPDDGEERVTQSKKQKTFSDLELSALDTLFLFSGGPLNKLFQ